MSYLHLPQLYKNQTILLFHECWALEKVHGTSAHIRYRPDQPLTYSSGAASNENFKKLFDEPKIIAVLDKFARNSITVFGEAYGGGGAAGQGMSDTYGKALQFIVFDIQMDDIWMTVPEMAEIAASLGLEVVPFEKIPATLEAIEKARDAPSEVAKRRGCGDDKQREGVVLRPLVEMQTSLNERVIVKHRIEAFSERKTPQKILDAAKLEVLTAATAIAEEWVTPMRLSHVLDKLPDVKSMAQTKVVIDAMIEDVYREAKGEIIESNEAAAAIGKRTAQLLKPALASRTKV